MPLRAATRLAPADPAERVSVCICLRRRPEAPPLGDFSRPPARVTHEEFGAVYGADPADVAQVEAFAVDHGLTVEGSSIPRRTVDVSGTVTQLNEAFGVDLGRYTAGETSYRGREGHVYLPNSLVPVVKGVFGLDNRPLGRSYTRAAASALGLKPLTPTGVAQLYRFPAGRNAAGQCIGLIAFGGGYHPEDITEWFKEQKLTPPELVDVSVLGGANTPKPWVTGVSPASGPAAGGTAVTITGVALGGAFFVSFGGAVVAASPGGTATQIIVTSPPGAGLADIAVTTAVGTSSVTAAGRFTYTDEATGPLPGPGPQVTGISPLSGPVFGGTAVTITGTGLIAPGGPTTVTFGGTKAAVSPGGTATQITVTSPSGIGLSNTSIAVTTPAGTSPAAGARTFLYTLDNEFRRGGPGHRRGRRGSAGCADRRLLRAAHRAGLGPGRFHRHPRHREQAFGLVNQLRIGRVNVDAGRYEQPQRDVAGRSPPGYHGAGVHR